MRGCRGTPRCLPTDGRRRVSLCQFAAQQCFLLPGRRPWRGLRRVEVKRRGQTGQGRCVVPAALHSAPALHSRPASAGSRPCPQRLRQAPGRSRARGLGCLDAAPWLRAPGSRPALTRQDRAPPTARGDAAGRCAGPRPAGGQTRGRGGARRSLASSEPEQQYGRRPQAQASDPRAPGHV